jgi:hypothetical protein
MTLLDQILTPEPGSIKNELMILSTKINFRVDSLSKLRKITTRLGQDFRLELITLTHTTKVSNELLESIQKLNSYKKALDIQRLNVEMKNLMSDYSTIKSSYEHSGELLDGDTKDQLNHVRLGLDLIYDHTLELFDFFQELTIEVAKAQNIIDTIALERTILTLNL